MPLKLTGLRTAGLVATRDCAAFSTSPLETAQRSTLFLRRADPQSRPPSKTQTSTTPLVTRCTGSRRLRWHTGHRMVLSGRAISQTRQKITRVLEIYGAIRSRAWHYRFAGIVLRSEEHTSELQ